MSSKTPLGIFWDIENCQIPRTKSTSSVVKHLRDFVAHKHPECGYAKEFCCACDVFRLGALISESLDKNGVNVVHVNSTAKNAAEDKLQELIDMYVDKYGGTGSVVLCIISSDINVAKQIRNARRRDLDVLLIHGMHCSDDLINLVNESYIYEDIVKNADNSFKDNHQKLGKLQNLPSASRSLNRIDGQNVFGNKIHVSLTEDLISNQLKNRSRSQHNLAKNADKTRKESMSQINLAQNSYRSERPVTDECKSVLKGLFTHEDDDCKQVVVNLVNKWNDTYIKPNLISDVRRSTYNRKGEGKHNLFITAIDPKANRALINGANKYLKPSDGLYWKPYDPHNRNVAIDEESVIEGNFSKRDQNVTHLRQQRAKNGKVTQYGTAFDHQANKTMIGGAKNDLTDKSGIHLSRNIPERQTDKLRYALPLAQNNQLNAGSKAHRPYKQTDSSITSVIKGLHTKSGENVKERVQKIVQDWNDSQIKDSFVKSVRRDGKFFDKDGDVLLFVTAISPEASQALVRAFRKYRHFTPTIKWSQYFPKRQTDDESNISECDGRFSLAQDFNIGCSLQNLNEILVAYESEEEMHQQLENKESILQMNSNIRPSKSSLLSELPQKESPELTQNYSKVENSDSKDKSFVKSFLNLFKN